MGRQHCHTEPFEGQALCTTCLGCAAAEARSAPDTAATNVCVTPYPEQASQRFAVATWHCMEHTNSHTARYSCSAWTVFCTCCTFSSFNASPTPQGQQRAGLGALCDLAPRTAVTGG